MKFTRSILGTICIVSTLTLAACTSQQATIDRAGIKSEVTDVLQAQISKWNAGDIDSFMEYYVKSDDLRFASGGSVKWGWQATIDNYKTRYTDKAAMGKLSANDLSIKVLSSEYTQVFGRWELQRESDKPGGLFTLLFQKIDGNWVIVSDHTSSN